MVLSASAVLGSFSRKHASMLASFLESNEVLIVPTQIKRSATTGSPQVIDPGRVTHLIFRALSLIHCPLFWSNSPTSQSTSELFSGLTALRVL